MELVEFAIVIGTGWALLVLAAVAKTLHSNLTPGGRAQALHNLFLEVYARRQYLVNELLPMLHHRHHECHELEGVEETTKQLVTYDHSLTFPASGPILTLHSLGSRKDTIVREVSYSWVGRWSLRYQKGEMEEMTKILMGVDSEISVCLFPAMVAGE